MECHLFSGRISPNSPSLKINNNTYCHWREIWESILQIPEGTSLPSDNFLRQDIISAITHREKVIGMIGASFFNIEQDAYASHSYLQAFSANELKKENSKSQVMSIEYLSVDPNFRKNELGFSLGSVLLSIGMKIFEISDVDVVLGTARSKIHVDEMCYKFGFSPLGEMNKFGHPCTIIINHRKTLRHHDNVTIESVANALWENRIDYINRKQINAA